MTIKTKKRIIALSIAGAVVAGWLGVTNHFDKMEAAEQAQRAAATEARQKADATVKAEEAQARLDRMPQDQLNLENIWVDGVSPYSIAWKASTNTIKMDQAYASATEATRKLLSGSGKSNTIGWYGRIYAINSYGDHVDLIVESPQGVDYEQDDIPKGSPLYNELADMQNGEWVTFSGSITPSDKQEDDNGHAKWNIDPGSDFATPRFEVALDDIEQSRK